MSEFLWPRTLTFGVLNSVMATSTAGGSGESGSSSTSTSWESGSSSASEICPGARPAFAAVTATCGSFEAYAAVAYHGQVV